MQKNILSYVILLGLLTAGFGVAGGGLDSKKNIEEANNYQRYISPRLSEKIIKNQIKCDHPAHFEDIFRYFSFHIKRIDKHPVELAEFGFVASFQNHEFLVQRKGETLIKERLPVVFNMHPICLGIDKLAGVPVIMVVNRSRASTGRCFVAIYMLDGTPLYRNVLARWQVNDIGRDNSTIDILGYGETRRFTIQKQ
ncbi:MAG: hypothetical protein A2W27_02840 [Deltaproteobacteria bacterium RBG_16_44_11]|nr:MAG: hypothetical protein A2W27_02840 [Deltaproteobacteria bacterium RBG_16_44_11]